MLGNQTLARLWFGRVHVRVSTTSGYFVTDGKVHVADDATCGFRCCFGKGADSGSVAPVCVGIDEI